MFFNILQRVQRVPTGVQSCAFLVTDGWDDWGKYRTMFTLHVADAEGVVHEIGSVKVGQVGLRPASTVESGQRTPELPPAFEALSTDFFSLGQGEDYYVGLNSLGEELSRQVLIGLQDCAFNLTLFEEHLGETVMTESLLRNVNENSVRSRLNRLTRGDAQLTEFKFSYTLPLREGVPPTVMKFAVLPESQPPSNVHVLIGRNGVGKTRCMRQLVESLLGRQGVDGGSPGEIDLISSSMFGDKWSFAGLVLISFSAFDDFDLISRASDKIGSEQVGLRQRTDVDDGVRGRIMSPPELAVNFRKSLERCRQGLKAKRWRAAIVTLETDDLFAETNVTTLMDGPLSADWKERAEDLFKRLSSGHAIVLLTVTRLVELVDEKTLVLLDEPEGHLHPPLLAAFIRCLSDLLVKRNGMAIISTHSPVVLQEVPRSCAWKLRRSGVVSLADRPAVETFGENIGVLTREVFGLEVTRSGFHKLLEESVSSGRDYDDIVRVFNGQLGFEARAIVQALIAHRDRLVE